MPLRFDRVHVESAALAFPGNPVTNDAMDAYIAPLNRASERIKRRVLAENGITQRYYALDAGGHTTHTHAQLAAAAARACLDLAKATPADVSLLAGGSSGGDVLMPGFANMIQGELAAPPMETLSLHGICAAGVAAVQAAAQAIELGAHARALAIAAEMPSRLFKRSRFASRGYEADFDSQFLRWMLSDGAGALLLGDGTAGRPTAQPGIALKLKWIHQRSFAGDYPVCMQLGLTLDRQHGHLDYPSWADAEADGALSLRQDIRLLPHLFDVSIHEYAQLVRDGWIDPARVNHFLCHYSSARFIPVVEDLMDKAGLAIPRERWWSNLAWRGNTGAASIFIMLAEFLQTRSLAPGEQILCFVPESGRFTCAYMLFEAEVAAPAGATSAGSAVSRPVAATPSPNPADGPNLAARAHPEPMPWQANDEGIAAPHDPADAPNLLRPLLTELAAIWHDYRSRVWRTPLIQALREQRFTVEDYQRWMAHWVPQVREGSLWMREAAASLTGPYAALAGLIEHHASDEQNDFAILFEDYRRAGGPIEDIDALRRNPGGDALNAYLHGLAARPNPIGLLGAIYIIEGTGQRIVPHLLPLLKTALPLPPDTYRFLHYHGLNDEDHLARWLQAVQMVMAVDGAERAQREIIDTARHTATLYQMQFQYVMEPGH